MTDPKRPSEPEIPADSDELSRDKAASEKKSAASDDPDPREEPNPPRTTQLAPSR
jgi:hypothetical protein